MNLGIGMKIYKSIGIIAPSSPVPTGLIDRSVSYFERLGFSVKLGKNIGGAELLAVGTDEERASDLMDFFKDDSVSAIITTNGGTCSIRTLSHRRNVLSIVCCRDIK